jgi:hypothetical protein
VLVKLSKPLPPVLEPQEFSVVADILNSLTGALASAGGISNTGLPTTQGLHGTVTLDELEVRMLKEMLVEFVRVPTEP